MAEILGVSRSRVSRWLRNERPDREDRRKLHAVEFVVSRLRETYYPETAAKWLWGFNAHLRNARPVDLLRMGRVAEVLEAVEALESGAYA